MCIVFSENLSASLRAGSVAVLSLHTIVILVTLVLNKVWLPVSILFELNAICLVLQCFDVLPRYMLLVSMLLLGKIYVLYSLHPELERYKIFISC